MENRFGFRDLIITVLLLGIIVSIWVEMEQRDREYGLLEQIVNQTSQQQSDLTRIEQELANGISVSTSSSSTQPSAEGQGRDPFDWIKKIEQRPDYARGDWLVENLPARVSKLTQLLSTDIYAQIVQSRVQESLAYTDPFTLEDVPLLATSWQQDSNVAAWQAYVDMRKKVPLTRDEILAEGDCPPADKPDQREAYVQSRMKEGRRDDDIAHEPDCPISNTITFQLRKGVQFSDGTPFTADDVVFTFDFSMNPKVDCPRVRASLDVVKACVKLNDYEVQFQFREPYFDGLDLTAGINIMPKKFYSQFSIDDFNNSVGLLLGEGPYRMEDPVNWKPTGDKIVLVRNERYWGEPGPFDRLVFTQVEGESVESTMFKNGEFDFMNYMVPEEYRDLSNDPKLAETSNHIAYDYPLNGYRYIGWNQRRNGKPTIFADKRVRQAMTMLIDRQAICDNIMYGYATPAIGPFAPGSKQHDPSIKPFPYDPDKARQILADLGFSDRNGTGVLVNAAGQELRFKLTYNSKMEFYQRIALVIKDEMAKAGIAAEPDPEDWPIVLKKLDDRDMDAIMLGWSSGIEDDIYQMFDTSQIAGDADNFCSYSDPKLDALMRAARMELDETKRMDLWHQCEATIADDQPYTFLMNEKGLAFYSKRLQNVEPARLGLNYVDLLVQPIPWYVPANMRKWSK
jgi:peptide/nickel transport system substrate-binding protein